MKLTFISLASPLEVMLEQVVKESHDTFVACFHVFFPTSALKWTILCKLLDQVQKVREYICFALK